jgi:CheY-like chemotaxis protein
MIVQGKVVMQARLPLRPAVRAASRGGAHALPPRANPPKPPAARPARADDAEPLLGKRVLIVEDEALVALELEMAFADAGAEVIGPALSLAQALALAGAEDIDYAVLDVDLAGEAVYPVAELLQRRGVRFLFHTGHASPRQHLALFAGAVTCIKPTPPAVLIGKLLD